MINNPGGILILNKSSGISSHDAVNRVRRLYETKQVGHTGTLDPIATGVLVVLVGRAVKCAEFFNGLGGFIESDKSYSCILRLGFATDTGDITGSITAESSSLPEESEVLSIIYNFEGRIMQIPPMYSALKRGGVKLVDLARQGITIEREPRPVTIKNITAERINETDYKLDVTCSKGTYMRVLCADIGKALGCYGTMAALQRTSAHGFSIDLGITLDKIEPLDRFQRENLLIPVKSIFDNLPKLNLPSFFAGLARNGCEIYLHKLGVFLAEGAYATMWDNGSLFAVGRVNSYENGLAIKSVRHLS